ncbi:hypothetical protein LPJ64_004935 [Coemansia asiatica]|uniref:Uncharacterized protein n=1 Tax=Coemansia asiatica TaxID=1052880 RepID=A0A9W7XHD7_9FUNG|nr:hypothetical protein LPJ64_004935 [Coemansia asiatica]
MFHNKRLCEKLVRDITKYIKRREYGKASELLLIIVENGSISISQIWQPLIATIRGQHGESQIDALLDTIAQATKKTPPFTASMERIYNLLDQDDLTNANRATMMFIEDHGNKLAFAHGYRGMLIACMREVDVRRKYDNSVFVEPCGFHVFESSRCLELRLTKDDPDLVSIFNLRHAEAHLRKALTMDPAVDMFRAFHIQVLIALGLIDQARDELELYYKDHPDIHILR